MSALPDVYRSATLPGLARAFRRWADTTVVAPVDVAGATQTEQHRLAALGGVAAAVAGRTPRHWHQVMRDWMDDAPTPPLEIVEAVRRALSEGADPLGALYETSISAPNRRRLGTVFTPPALVEHMLGLAEGDLDEAPAVVIDPGAGVGAFALAAAKRWPTARVVASDINPVTLGLLGARLEFEAARQRDSTVRYRDVELWLGDYLDHLDLIFTPDRVGPVLVLGNPPYTRVQELPREARVKASQSAGSFIDSGHANLAMLFQAATLRRMKPRDTSCMVIPGSFSYTRATRALRAALWRSSRSLAVHRTRAEAKAFTGRAVQAAILCVGTELGEPSPVQLARIELEPDRVDVTERWTLSREDAEPENWFWSGAGRTEPPATVALGEIATVRRGAATGANDFFFLNDSKKARLPEDVVTCAMPTLRAFAQHELSVESHRTFGDEQTRRWLLAIPPTRPLSGPLAAYISEYEEVVSSRHLSKQRAVWYAITELPRPEILVSPLAQTAFKVVLNTARAVPSNNLFGITCHERTDPRQLAKWLRSSAGQDEMLRLSRRYPGGSHKIEPSLLREIRVPRELVRS